MPHEHDQTHRSTAGSAPAQAQIGDAPSASHLALVHRKIMRRALARAAKNGNGVTDHADDSVARAAGSAGSPLPGPIQRKFEGSLGADLSQVRVHTGGESAVAAESVSARAYTIGNDIHFNAGQFDPSSRAGEHLLAHEVAHTLQQSGSTSRQPQFKLEVSSPGDSHEHEADHAADAMVQGRPASISPTAGGVSLARAAVTNGGSFDTTAYTATNTGAGVGKGIGAHIHLTFTPNDLVEADTIGLIQSVKTLKATAAGTAPSTPSNIPAPSFNDQLALGPGPGNDVGRAIDQGDGSHGPNTNPFSAVENPAGSSSATLTDVLPPAGGGFGEHGHRKRLPTGVIDMHPANLDDTPNRSIAFAGQQWQQSFEVTALIPDGPMANTYLGSVEWGWKVDAAGLCTTDPNPIRVLQAGAPTTAFMGAARKWNAATLTDPATGVAHPTVDIPLTTTDSGSVAASARTTTDLISRLNLVNTELAALAAGVDKTNKEFEKRALETELRTRNAKVNVKVSPTAPVSGGASRSDAVAVTLRAGGRTASAPAQPVTGGIDDLHFDASMGTLLPIVDPITVEVSSGTDALAPVVATIPWAAPFAPSGRSSSNANVGYDVEVRFDR